MSLCITYTWNSDVILSCHAAACDALYDKHVTSVHHNDSKESVWLTLGKKKNTMHQLTTMLSTSKNVLFPGHNHLLTTVADDPAL